MDEHRPPDSCGPSGTPSGERPDSQPHGPEQDPTAGLPDGLREAFDHIGRLRFDQFMELALYAPASGFFATTGRAGRRTGDFITSPEVGPLFGSVVAQHLDDLWHRLGRPHPFTVIEAGAGRGALAIAVRAARPACAGALHWAMVERSASLRAEHGEHLELVEWPDPGPPDGPRFSSLPTLPEPAGSVVGAVVANELLDNLPFRLLERHAGTWREVMVALRAESATDAPGRGAASLVEEFAGVPDVVATAFDEIVPDAVEGARVPWQPQAASWVRSSLDLLERGEVLVFDYARSTAALASRPQQEWLRTYRSHTRGTPPLDAPGTQDITVEVALDQLPVPDDVATQAEWLASHGMGELVAEADRLWSERASVGDLDAIRARSVGTEAAALADPDGLGAFTVMCWQRRI